MKVPDEDVEYVIRKLTSHFAKRKKKMNPEILDIFLLPRVRFYGNRQSGSSSSWRRELRLSHNPSMGLILHEFAHMAHSKKVFADLLKKQENIGTTHHGYHYEICLRQIHEYAKSRKYWEQVLKNRIHRRFMKK